MENYTLKPCAHCQAFIPKKKTIGWPRYYAKQFCSKLCSLKSRYVPSPQVKHCAYCDAPLKRLKQEGVRAYARRKYCNRQCIADHRHGQRFDGQGNKWCSACGQWKPLDEFSGQNKVNGSCRRCCSDRVKRSRDADPEGFNAKRRARKDKIDVKLRTLLREARTRARNGGFAFDLTLEYLLGQWEEQQGYCFYSGLPMTNINDGSNHRTNKITNLSLDRIDPSKGYTIGNVVFCQYAVNTMKMVLSVEDFLNYAFAIAGNADAVINKLRSRNA